MGEKLIKKSKYLSMLLRHRPEEAGLHMDKHGWVSVEELEEKASISRSDLETIVETDSKGRYSFSEDKKMIRANQGHSIKWVEIEFDEVTKSDIERLGGYLYHGTGSKNKQGILEKGINKGSRNYVHLSKDVKTAETVGKRHGEPFIFKIKAVDMLNDGIKIYKSKNGVYLVDFVDTKYIIEDGFDSLGNLGEENG